MKIILSWHYRVERCSNFFLVKEGKSCLYKRVNLKGYQSPVSWHSKFKSGHSKYQSKNQKKDPVNHGAVRNNCCYGIRGWDERRKENQPLSKQKHPATTIVRNDQHPRPRFIRCEVRCSLFG